MGYTHGIKWDRDSIEIAIKAVMSTAKIDTFPTRTLIRQITGNEALGCAISRNGGTQYWAKRLGVEMKRCESKMGHEYECMCKRYLTIMGYNCEFTSARYPYDILVNDNIKIDVKSGKLHQYENGKFFTFNIEKEMPTCDIYVCYCVNKNDVDRVYVIPSCIISGITQLSIGEKTSKYDRFIDNWNIVQDYQEFYKYLADFKE